MTNRTLSPSPEGFQADLRAQQRQAARAQVLLEHACAVLDNEAPHEPPGDKAQRLRGAAIAAQSAISELLVTVGWLEAAQTAEQRGLTETNRD